MPNERLNQILTVRINLPMLCNLIEDCNNVIIKKCVEKYYNRKKWRWSVRKEKEVEITNQDVCCNPPPTKKRVIDLTNYDISDDDQQADSEEESFESSFEDGEDYEIEDDEKFPEIT